MYSELSSDEVLDIYDTIDEELKIQCWMVAINMYMYDHRVVRGLSHRLEHISSCCSPSELCTCVACIMKAPHPISLKENNKPTPIETALYAFRCVICIQLGLWQNALDFYTLANISKNTFITTKLTYRYAFDFIEKHWLAARIIQKTWRKHALVKKRMNLARVCKHLGLTPHIANVIWIHGRHP